MSRSRWRGHAVGVLAVAALLVGVTAPSLRAAPNPYGPRSTATTIVLHRDGSYDVTLRQTQELVREFEMSFGGGVHDGFRLPDDGGLLPPYLRAGYALTFASTADGQPPPTDFERKNHRVSVTSVGTYPTGRHEFQVSYRVTGASKPTKRGWTVHVRLLEVTYSPGDRVEIDASAVAPSGLVLRCVTYPPDSEPCGTTGGSTLIDLIEDDREVPGPPEFQIEVEADNAAVPMPTIDRR
jgi:hypothetical protein